MIAFPFGHGELKLGERRRFAKALPPYDRAIVLPGSLKSALVPWFAGIPVRTGWRGEMRYGLLNDLRHLDERALPLIVERYAALAQPAGEALERPLPEPRLAVDAARPATPPWRSSGSARRFARPGARPRRRVRPRQALAGAPLRRGRPPACRSAASASGSSAPPRTPPSPRRSRPLAGVAGGRPRGQDQPRRGDRPPVARRPRGDQRLRPHARGGRPRPADGGGVRLVQPGLHAAAVGARRASSRCTSTAAPASSASARWATRTAWRSSTRRRCSPRSTRMGALPPPPDRSRTMRSRPTPPPARATACATTRSRSRLRRRAGRRRLEDSPGGVARARRQGPARRQRLAHAGRAAS